MAMAKDLTGQRFGRLVVIRRSNIKVNGKLTWECKCSCGNPEIILSNASNLGTNKNSCGCLKMETLTERHRGNIRDITGKRFGRLVAKKRWVDSDNTSYWLCDCDCGKEVSVPTNNLGRGTSSCGCLRSISAIKRGEKRIIDLTGKQYGRLTVIGLSDKRIRGRITWRCQCSCGTIKHVTTSFLGSGKCRSCGCLASDNIQRMLEKELKDNTRLCLLNQKVRSNNSSGTKGVAWMSERRKWGAYLTVQGKRKHLGYFDDINDAIKARKQGELDYFKPLLNKYGRELK